MSSSSRSVSAICLFFASKMLTSSARPRISCTRTLKLSGMSGRRGHLALHDALVDLGAAHHVVALDGEKLLQRVGRAVRLQRPDLHLSEPLAAELGLAAQGLLRDQGVGAGGAGVHLVVHQVVELQNVDGADGDLVLEGLAGAARRRRVTFDEVGEVRLP